MPKEIALTQGRCAIVDEGDYAYLNEFKWYAMKCRNMYYAVRRVKENRMFMHHELIGRPEGFQTDHVNGNGLDNRRENLRHVTARQNSQNRHLKKSSSYPGVCYHIRDQKWVAHIRVGGSLRHLGYFSIERDAFLAYLGAIREIGESDSVLLRYL